MEKIKLILFLTLLCSCNTSQKKITKVERISLEAEVITDSIHASLPGRLIVFNDYVVWEEVFATDKFFAGIYTDKTGKEYIFTLLEADNQLDITWTYDTPTFHKLVEEKLKTEFQKKNS